MTLWSKTITYLPSTDIGGPGKFIKLEPLRLTGTGEIRSASLLLNSKFGAFLNNTNSGTTPIIDEFDKIKISVTDKLSTNYTGVFIVDTLRQINDGSGPKLQVDLLGQERWLQLIHMPHMKMSRISHFEAIKKIVDIANANLGTSQVTIEKHDDVTFNEAPKWTANDYDFTDEPTIYDALMRIIGRLNTTIANGGANDFFELYFEDNPTDATKIRIKVFSSGELPASPVTIENTNTTRIYSKNGTKEAKTGNRIIAEAQQGAGSIPSELAKFVGKLDSFNLQPEHDATLTYPVGARVQLAGVHYQANTSTSNTPPHADWDIIKHADVIGLIPPSPYTYKKAVSIWKNSGANPTGGTRTSFDDNALWDGNLVIRDEDHWRDWAHVKSTTDNFNVFYKYGSVSSGNYRGLRALVNGVGTGAFAGHDNKLMQYDGTAWQEIGPLGAGGIIRAAVNNDVVAIRDEAKNYIFNGSAWVDDSANPNANDCFHIYKSITNDVGVSSVTKQKGDGTWLDLDGDTFPDTGETYGTDSAVKIVYEYSPIDTISSSIFSNPNFYKLGCWANIEFPLTANTFNGITESVGEIYGGDSTKKEPATFDAEGFFGLTPTGKQGLNFSDSDELGARDSIKFMANFKMFSTSLGLLVPFQSKFKWRCIVYDTSGNTVFQDFEILDNAVWEQIELPLNQFKPYRARAVRKWGNAASNLILPELEVLDRFFWKNTKMICFQTQESYDDAGRYDPIGGRYANLGSIVTGSVQLTLMIDAFHFTGKLVSLSPPNTTQNIEAVIQRPNTFNHEQLFQDSESQKEIEQHRYDAWEIVGEGFLDQNFGESIFLKDTKLINDSDNGPNTKKTVVKEIEINLNGTDGGAGGFSRKMLVVKRI